MIDLQLAHRPTIGVLINEFDGMYQRKVRFGLEWEAQKRGANLVFFVGKALFSPYSGEAEHNIIYTLAGKERLDGLVLMAGALANFCGETVFVERIRSYFGSLPMVSVAWELKGFPSVLVDNKTGIHEAVNHLVQAHRRRKIAFIRGPRANSEAEARYEAYCEALKANGLSFDSELVYDGDFVYETGGVAVRTLLDERNAIFDGLISANDDMLVTACSELGRRGIDVPRDVSVTGYDDLERASFMTPPYTTVSQPLFEQGEQAVALLLDKLEGKEVPGAISIPSKLAIRESCGCLSAFSADQKPDYLPGNKAELMERMAALLLPEEAEPQFTSMFSELLDFLESPIPTISGPEHFLNLFNRILAYSIHNRWRINSWAKALDELKNYFENGSKGIENPSSAIRNDLLYRCQMMVGEAIWRQGAGDRIPLYDLFWRVRDFVNRTNSCFRMEDFAEAIREKLPPFEMDTCLIALYRTAGRRFDEHRWTRPPKVKLTLACVGGYIRKVEEERSVYPAQMLFPEDLISRDRPYCLVVQPLFIGSEHYGFLVLNRAHCEPLIYATLREQVSSVIRTMCLFIRQQEAEEKLKKTLKAVKSLNKELQSLSLRDDLTGLYNRRGFTVLGEERFRSVKAGVGKFLLLFMDLDGLKTINDTYGHNEGDVAIRAAAKILKKAFREPTDLIARFGGDEFLVVAFGCSDEHLGSIKARIDRLLHEYNRMHEDKPYRLHLSIGSSAFDGLGEVDFKMLLEEADKTLYRQKALKFRRAKRLKLAKPK